jgi:hypothetical protein
VGLVGPDGAPVDALLQELSAVDGAVDVEVAVALEGDPARAADGLVVEVGLAPDAGAILDWSPATFVGSEGAEARFRGSVQPETLGDLAVAARVSTDGGATWQPASGAATIHPVAGPDTDPPVAPVALELREASADAVALRWDESEALDLLRYLVLRAESGPGDTWGDATVIGRTDVAVFRDATVVPGTRYRYAVQAQDTAYNSSPPSEALEVVAETAIVPGHLHGQRAGPHAGHRHALHRR